MKGFYFMLLFNYFVILNYEFIDSNGYYLI